MSRASETRAIISGTIRRPAMGAHTVHLHDSIRCVQATSARELARAQRFWIHRYREAGLQGVNQQTPSFDSLSLPQVPAGPLDPPSRITNWRPMVFLAYYSADPKQTRRAKLRSIPNRSMDRLLAPEQICGTVTLLVPNTHGAMTKRTGSHAIGRITRLAVDHSWFWTGDTPTGYRTVFLEMTSCMHRTALQAGLTHLDAIVHPRHAKLYRRVFGAEPIGKPFACEQVGGSPGQYMRADITQPSAFHARLRDRYQAKAAS
ncbi:N-acyl amino acid synthase FeeM domain-containing protein [Planctomycetes bacterium TBK1r]